MLVSNGGRCSNAGPRRPKLLVRSYRFRPKCYPWRPSCRFAGTYLDNRIKVVGQGRRGIVPADVWVDEVDQLLGTDTPELAAHRLVDTGRIATMLGN
jgi:hypothetical protein